MKVLVIGSSRHAREEAADVEKIGRDLGKELVKRGHTVVVFSDDPTDVDYHVVEGAREIEGGVKRIEIHVPNGEEIPYATDEQLNNRVWHQFPDWDVTIMEVIRRVDAVMCIGGKIATIQAGISAWMMEKAIIPVGAVRGGGRTVWEYGSRRRADFFHEALNDSEIDRLASPWSKHGSTASFVVDAVENVHRSIGRKKISLPLIAFTLVAMVLALVGWVVLLGAPVVGQTLLFDWDVRVNFFMVFATVGAAGLHGSFMHTLRCLRRGDTLSLRAILIDTSLGLAAGVVSAALYLLAQLAVSGAIEVILETPDYVRVALIMSIVALFSALYLDSAFTRFDTIRGSMIRGQYKELLEENQPSND